MPKGQSEVEKFFDGLPSTEGQGRVQDYLDEEQGAGNVTPEKEGAEGTLEKGDEPRKNRRHRRLEQQLQTEREARIAAEARAAGKSEAERFVQGTTGDVPEKWLRIYGDTPESRQAWSVQKELFDGVKSEAKAEAIREIEERQEKARQQEKQFESFIDTELENIEDEFEVDVTSDTPAARKARREFLELVEKLSPKDANGTITGYADFQQTWEMYQKSKTDKKDTTVDRQKELANRGMERTTTTTPQREVSGGEQWLRDNGIIQ